MNWRWAIVFGAIACLGIVIITLQPRMMLVRHGNAADLWDAALVLHKREPVIPGLLLEQPVGHWLAYTNGGSMEMPLWYGVSETEVEAGLESALQQFEATRFAGLRRSWIVPVVDQWKQQRGDARQLVTMMLDARYAYVRSQNPSLGKYDETKQQAEILELFQRGDRWPVTAIFEFLYLGFMIVIVASPWVRRSNASVWAICWGALPVLLILPMWLGYAAGTFTSIAPMSGGIVYPWLLLCVRDLFGDACSAPLAMWLDGVCMVPGRALGGLPVPAVWVVVLWGLGVGTCAGTMRWLWGQAAKWIVGRSRPAHV